jgi:hypothetical protein
MQAEKSSLILTFLFDGFVCSSVFLSFLAAGSNFFDKFF